MATEPEEYLAVLKASYDYTPQSEDEIAMEENQLLFLLQRVDEE
jgi:actin cytoskeleton-regulatory complex protein SLA1